MLKIKKIELDDLNMNEFARIKIIDSEVYVKCILWSLEGIRIIPDNKSEAAIYELDKAEKYVKILNEQNTQTIFEIEKLKKGGPQ